MWHLGAMTLVLCSGAHSVDAAKHACLSVSCGLFGTWLSAPMLPPGRMRTEANIRQKLKLRGVPAKVADAVVALLKNT